MFESRVSETNLRLNIHPKLGYEVLIKSILNSGLVIKNEDEEGLKIVAETSKIKSLISNSYGEVVTFSINGYQNDSYCLVNINSKGCSSLGSYTHSTIFQKSQKVYETNLVIVKLKRQYKVLMNMSMTQLYLSKSKNE